MIEEILVARKGFNHVQISLNGKMFWRRLNEQYRGSKECMYCEEIKVKVYMPISIYDRYNPLCEECLGCLRRLD